eukprot:TRINITY_DN748_c0_g2_i1.p1 TRINITY_DN748_c0_g2~~TRINITY_DN748_c0_g2_i1.p1  ORF type:complete len:149 (-),score=37.44 TRINITY_DN748_c0_g2_i1:153-599(-)
MKLNVLLAVVFVLAFSGYVKADNFICLNYCNITYDFGSTCNAVNQALINSAGNQTDYAVIKQNSNFLHVVHQTVSQCCPIGHQYFEDISITLDPEHDGGCTAYFNSVSRDGSCDFGQDITNILTLVDFAYYNNNLSVDSGPTVTSGCF